MPIETISVTELAARLAQVKGAQPIHFTALVDARARKTNNPFTQGIFKLSRVSAFTGFDYENSVNRQQTREGGPATFEAQERSWGERIAPALVEKDGKLYLVAKVEHANKPIYLVRGGRNGMLIPMPKAIVAPWLPAPKSSAGSGGEETSGVSQLLVG